MSRTKDLKNDPKNNVNLYDMLSLFCPTGKSKYVDTLLRIIKKTIPKDSVNEIRKYMSEMFFIDETELKNFSELELILFFRFIETSLNFGDLKSYKDFCILNERNLIRRNDLSTYNSFEEVIAELNIAELLLSNKELEKQTLVIHNDNEWVLLKPLTYLSSRKYGANTKWCTTSDNETYFHEYASNGILIYCINKTNGYKVAVYSRFDKTFRNELTFWDQKDKRIDSIESELPDNLKKLILQNIRSSNPNRDYLSKEEKDKEMGLKKSQINTTGYADLTGATPTEIGGLAEYFDNTNEGGDIFINEPINNRRQRAANAINRENEDEIN